ncbi:MAG: AsnC family transcriptional regulator [Candidatus Riflebacteria bacterium]|nr:AsnC family transcriptional regulator [Candidatus Riflebacteria bacterium]
MDSTDQKLMSELQEELKLERRPFLRIAKNLGLTEEEVLSRIDNLLKQGLIRRLGLAVKPEKLGHTTNVMIAWNVPEEKMEEVGAALAGFSEISHCYERDTPPDWKHRLFTMIHARSEEQLQNIIQQVKDRFDIDDYRLFRSLRELKKASLKIFPEAEK